MASPTTHHEEAATTIEKRSIDHIPDSERHGTLKSLGAVWFVTNLPALGTGTVAATMGGSLFWALVAILVGVLFGTIFMALHSTQGPQLGLPQLVQSRAQFGYAGAALTVFVAVYINYVTYTTNDALQLGAAVNIYFDVPPEVIWGVVITAAAVIAVFGYDMIHKANRILAIPLIIITIGLTIAAFSALKDPSVLAPGTFQLAPFMTIFVMTAGFQLSWAPYVSDYSRYLPASTSPRSLFLWTYVPSALSGFWAFIIGAAAQSVTGAEGPMQAINSIGNSLLPGFGVVVVVVQVIGLMAVNSVNLYGGSLTLISIADSIRPVSPTKAKRIVTVVVTAVIAMAMAILIGPDGYYAFYASVLVYLAYLFTPWTAINLVDYFIVRKRHYDIAALFDPSGGRYGRWGLRGNGVYLVTLAAMVPFMVTTNFQGFIAKAAGGVDYSMFVGLGVGAALYWLVTRNQDHALPIPALVVDEPARLEMETAE